MKKKKLPPAAVQTNLLDISVFLDIFDRNFCLRSTEISTSWPPANLCVYRNGTVGRRGRDPLLTLGNVTASPCLSKWAPWQAKKSWPTSVCVCVGGGDM